MLLLSFGGNWWLAAMSHPQGFSVSGGEYKFLVRKICWVGYLLMRVINPI